MAKSCKEKKRCRYLLQNVHSIIPDIKVDRVRKESPRIRQAGGTISVRPSAAALPPKGKI